MSELRYSVWEEGGLHHWAVHLQSRSVCGRGAATDLVRARAEAIDFGLDPARAEDIVRIEKRRREALFQSAHRASAEAHQRVMIANYEVAYWRASCAMSFARVEKSLKAIAQSRQLLDVSRGS